MSRKHTPYQGATDVIIPIDEIYTMYCGWADVILDKLASSAVEKIRRNARQFKVKTGILKKRIGKKRSKYDRLSYIAGANAPHAHLLENGHAIVKNGIVLGHVPARPFVKPAEDEVKQEIMEVVKEVLGDHFIEVSRG